MSLHRNYRARSTHDNSVCVASDKKILESAYTMCSHHDNVNILFFRRAAGASPEIV